MPLTPEQLARQQIDAQLAACGWVVQDYYMAMDFGAGRGIALREVPLKHDDLASIARLRGCPA